MSKFRQVQFIGYAISTKPAFCAVQDPADAGNRKYYLGYAQDERDLEARLELLATVVKQAQGAFVRDDHTLKCFVIPEFFFRGASGAYRGRDVEARLKTRLAALLGEFGPDINMAVWGSALLVEQDLDLTAPVVKEAGTLGDDYLHVYETCREFRARLGKDTPSVRDILFHLDELEDPARRSVEPDLDPLAAVLEQMLRGCDRSAPVTISNKCLIMLERERCLAVQKQFKSCVDFVLNYYHDKARTKGNENCYLQTFVKYPPIAPKGTEEKRSDADQYSIFQWENWIFCII